MTELELIQEKIKSMPNQWGKILAILEQIEKDDKQDEDDILGMFRDKPNIMDEILEDIMNHRKGRTLRAEAHE